MTIHSEVQGEVARFVIDNPDKGNALSPAMMVDLAAGLRAAAADGVRVAVVRGAGERVFCSGYDLTELPTGARLGPDEDSWEGRFPELTDLVRAVESFPVPLIAQINGHAVGGGALLVSMCDLRLAREGVRFQIPASRLGVLYPLEGIRRTVALLGLGRATQVLLLADSVSTEQGLAWGLYQEVVSVEQLAARVDELSQQLTQRAPLSVQGLVAVTRALAAGEPAGKLLELQHRWATRCLGSEDLTEGVAALLQRRPPRFEGR